jgi:hypothetical protein
LAGTDLYMEMVREREVEMVREVKMEMEVEHRQ